MTPYDTVSINDTDAKIEFYPHSAVVKELKAIPKQKRDKFLLDLSMMAKGLPPISKVTYLTGLGNGVFELKINGSPAWRCIYYTKISGKIVVVHVTDKTTNGRDSQIANVVEERLKALKQQDERDNRDKPKR